MDDALGKTHRTLRGKNTPNISSRAAPADNRDWLQDQFAQKSTKQAAHDAGFSPKAAENIRLGRNKISFDKLVDMCRADPAFAAAFAEHIGLILPGEAEFAGALTSAFNAYQRKGARG